MYVCPRSNSSLLFSLPLPPQASNGVTRIVLADPPGSVLYSFIKSGGKKMERSGSSVTEGSLCLCFVACLCAC